MSRPRYRLIDHTADMAFDVEGADWADLLAQATRAVADILLEERAETLDAPRKVSVAGPAREDKHVAWLNEAAVRF